MTIDSMMLALFNDLEPWAREKGGMLSVAQSQWDALEILIQGPAGVQFILAYGGDDAEGDQAQDPLGNAIIELIVGYNTGLQAKSGAALMKNLASRPSLLRLVSEARARLLTARFPETETMQVMAYGGTTPVVVENMPLSAYRIRAVLPGVIETETEYRDLRVEE